MLRIEVILSEDYDESKGEFIEEFFELDLEHSLLSLSKWEASFEKPFLGEKQHTPEETLAYAKAMVLTPNVPSEIFEKFTQKNFDMISEYIVSNQSATTINEVVDKSIPHQVITSELVYSWMIALNIPFECETWHFNRLMNLIKICNIKQAPPKKMSRQEIARRNKELNEKRRKELNSRG